MTSAITAELVQWMRDIRRTIHHHPELGYREEKTVSLIEAKLRELDVTLWQRFGGTGLRVILNNGQAGEHVALRADMDALPIQETTGLSFSSVYDGVMHGCGHDGHVAMLLGAIALLQHRRFPGKISCIFQPAEEHGNGAQRLVEEGVLEDDVTAIFAGHIDTHFPTGIITVDEGVICASSDPFSYIISGRGGHAARPHEARDSLVAGVTLVTALQTIVSRETDPNRSAVVTVGRFHAGEAHNIIAEKAVIDGTVRATDPSVRQSILKSLQRMGEAIGLQNRVQVKLEFHHGLPMVNNLHWPVQIATDAAVQVVGEEKVVSQGPASLGGEDFAYYQQVVPGCLVRFGGQGAKKTGPAHSSTFDFDEEVLATGAAWLAEVACQALGQAGGGDGKNQE